MLAVLQQRAGDSISKSRAREKLSWAGKGVRSKEKSGATALGGLHLLAAVLLVPCLPLAYQSSNSPPATRWTEDREDGGGAGYLRLWLW